MQQRVSRFTEAAIMTPLNPDFLGVVRSSFARQGLMTLLGARLEAIEPGRVVIAVPNTPALTQQAGLFHGGVIGALADSAGGYAALSLMPAGSEVVTVEYKINFMRGAAGAVLRATGDVLRPGRSITVARITCAVDEHDPCAVLQATFLRVDA
jgi:uncharacterized protein (TIGR00369 family)